MLMTVLMEDAARKLPPEDRDRLDEGSLAELLYADDTLLLSVSAKSLERFLSAAPLVQPMAWNCIGESCN